MELNINIWSKVFKYCCFYDLIKFGHVNKNLYNILVIEHIPVELHHKITLEILEQRKYYNLKIIKVPTGMRYFPNTYVNLLYTEVCIPMELSS